MVPGKQDPWPEVRDQLNRLLRGWSTYFSYGTRLMAYRAVDNYVYDRVRHFHAVWHICVITGSAIHFLAILHYVVSAGA